MWLDMPEDLRSDATLIVGLLRDHLTLWTNLPDDMALGLRHKWYQHHHGHMIALQWRVHMTLIHASISMLEPLIGIVLSYAHEPFTLLDLTPFQQSTYHDDS
jgi:hypothetical protein